jgi:hypothetical protein
MEEILKLAETDRDAAVERLMAALKIGWAQAALILAVELGEWRGDLFTVDAAGKTVPLSLPPFDWRSLDK